jgi:hypothetical protein
VRSRSHAKARSVLARVELRRRPILGGVAREPRQAGFEPAAHSAAAFGEGDRDELVRSSRSTI